MVPTLYRGAFGGNRDRGEVGQRGGALSVAGLCFIQWHLQGVSGCQALSAYVHTLKMPPSCTQAGPPRGPGAHVCKREPRQAQGPCLSEVNDP